MQAAAVRPTAVQPFTSASAQPAAASASRDAPVATVESDAAANPDRSNPSEIEADPTAAAATASDSFAADPATAALLGFVQSLVDDEVSGVAITPQQASVLRYLLTRPWSQRVRSAAEAIACAAEPASQLLLALQADHSAASVARFQATLSSLVARHASTESRCRSSQLEEVEALRAIFGGDARELVVYMTHPVTLKVAVQTEHEIIDCRVEVGAAMSPLYPEEEALHVCAFVPPPFQGLRIAVASEAEHNGGEGGDEGRSNEGRMVSVEEALQSLLDRRAAELAQDGESAVYTLVEETRAFLAQHSEALLAALVARDGTSALEGASAVVDRPQASSSSSKVSSASITSDASMQLHPVTLWGRGRIERLESAAIRDVQLACDLPESLARAALREARWDVQACIDAQRKGAAAATSDSGAMPPSMRPIIRQDSLPDRARFALLQDALAPFLADPQRTLECGACGDPMQLREAAGQICAHMLCVACWHRMLATHIAAGEAFIRCPGYRCDSQVEEGLLLALAPTPAHYARYRRWLQNNFIQLRGWRWCSNPRCDRVVATATSTAAGAGTADPSVVVSCDCLVEWCLSCGKEGHWPVECGTADRYGSMAVVSLLRQLGEPAPLPPDGPSRFYAEFDAALTVECKPCPKCSTLWFRDGGCDHITCRQCMHEYCQRCLQPYPHSYGEECVDLPMTRLLFTEGVGRHGTAVTLPASDSTTARVGADGKMRVVIEDADLIAQLGGTWFEKEAERPKDRLVQLPPFVRAEAEHHRASRRLMTLLRLLETTPLPVAPVAPASAASPGANGGGGGGGVAAPFAPFEQAELNSLLLDLAVGPAQRRTLASLLAFLRQCHGLLHGCCMYLAVYGRRLEPRAASKLSAADVGARVLESLAQLEYFVRALDEVLLPAADQRRSVRTLARMHGADRASAFKCALTLREAMAAFCCEQEKVNGSLAALDQQLTAAAAALTLTAPTSADHDGPAQSSS